MDKHLEEIRKEMREEMLGVKTMMA